MQSVIMEWIYENLQLFALFSTTLWFFLWLWQSRSATGWLFELKRQLAFRWLSMRQKDATRASHYSTRDMENIIDGVFDREHDSKIVSYYGTDQKNNCLYIKIHHRRNKPSELVIFLKLENGRAYELPDHPNTVISDAGGLSWSGAGLKISVLQTTKRTRILFNGLLRQGNRTDVNDNTDDVQHLRLNCIFIANTKPYSQKEYWDKNLLAKTLAFDSWKNTQWERILNNLDIDETDQYGSIMAEVTFEDSSSKHLYLRGMRQSQWGKLDAASFDRNITITATDIFGISFHLRLADLKDGVKNMQLGHVKDPEDYLNPIKSISFDTDQLLDRYNNGFDEYEFKFSAGKRKFEALIKLRRETLKTLYGGFPWDSQYTYCQFQMKLNGNSGVGMIQIWQPYSGLCPISISSPEKLVKPKKSMDDKQIYTLLFEDERCQAEALVGGKGASLAQLTAIKTIEFTVPKGFCVTVNAFEAHVKYHTNLMDVIDEFVEICYGKKAGDVIEHSQKVVTAFQSTLMLHMVQTAILETFKNLEGNNGNNTYAVRSSAVGEDSEDTSAAGQNSTFLGIKSVDAIVKYVAHCWASLYTRQSVEYRRQHGLPIKASMGVCVQQMVNAEVAGVMFTRHPISGNPKEIFITSNYGLGESVVSALSDPDTIIIQRSQKNSLSIKSSTIGKKSRKITVNSSASGTIHSDVSESEKSKLSISEEMAVKLVEIGIFLDRLYNAARDIEWAIYKEHVYLLQCRPVTALDAWTEFELTHELGAGVPNDNDILTLANVGEVLPMIATPLTMTIILGINIAAENNFTRCSVNEIYKHNMFVFNGKCFLNYASFFLRSVDKKIPLGHKVMEIAVCGRLVITPEINEMGLKRNGGPINSLHKLKLMSDIGADLWNGSRAIKQANEITERCRKISKARENLSSEQSYEALNELITDYIKLSSLHTHTTKCSIFSQVMIMSILTEGSEDLSAEHYSDIAVLLGSCSDVVSAQVPLALKEITQTIKKSGLSEEFKSVDPSKALPWLLIHCPQAHEQVQKFIDVHGHRGIEEFELITETWGMKPEKFLSTVQSMLNSTTDSTIKNTIELSPQETVALLKNPRKSSTRWIISRLLPWMRRTVSRREHTKCLLIELVHLMRMAYRRLAELLVQEGRLPEPELIFFFTHEELAQVIRGPNPNLMRKAVGRRKLRPKLQKYKYNEVNYGIPKPIEEIKVAASSGGARIQGTSVCNGMATGRACVALSLEEAVAIQPGDILITHSTDIGWSPYFPLLAGIVTELGGLISHGAVVAREYGLPCIVSAENATATFETGDTVVLNGYAGTIEVVKESQTDTS